MQTDQPFEFERFSRWYRQHARRLLTECDSSLVDQFDKDLEEVAARTQAGPPATSVCFLGNSGVGKSTLINATVAGAQSVLPAGGVGPLTAQALVVNRADSVSMKVSYHDPQRLNTLVLNLRTMFRHSLRSPEEPQLDPTDEVLEDALYRAQEADPSANSTREEYRRQGCLMVDGDQGSNRRIKDLLPLLALIQGTDEREVPASVPAEIRDRIKRLRDSLRLGRILHLTAEKNGEAVLRKELKAHACTMLAGHN